VISQNKINGRTNNLKWEHGDSNRSAPVRNLRKQEKTDAEIMLPGANMQAVECIIDQKKFGGICRYSARTRVVIGEKSVRIVQRMKNPAARKAASSF